MTANPGFGNMDLKSHQPMMYAMSVDQDIACRTVGRCVHGDILDQEMNSLMPLEKERVLI